MLYFWVLEEVADDLDELLPGFFVSGASFDQFPNFVIFVIHFKLLY